jgi:hypothetical protein
MLENGKMVRDTDKELTHLLMEKLKRVSGKITNLLEKKVKWFVMKKYIINVF